MPESKRLIGPAFTERRTAARMTRSVREFMELEVAGGTVLLAAVIVALLWANSPWKESYETLWATELEIGLGAWSLGRGLRDWVNEGLMTGFFFVIGLEIKRELVKGELSSVRRAVLPAAAALGGMILPAGIFLALNVGSGSARGWGIPIATDVALALGVLAILGSRVPGEVRILLLSVAIVDDIGAIIVIAVFYSGAIEWASLAAAGALVGLILGLRVIRVWWIPAYVVVGSLFWLAMLLSGVHSTIAGVVLGLLTPVRPLSGRALRRPPLPEGGPEASGGSGGGTSCARSRGRSRAGG